VEVDETVRSSRGDSRDGESDSGSRDQARWWGWLAWVLSLAGLGESIYLTIDHFRGTFPTCPANGFIDCRKVTTSGESYLFHIPVALIGLVFFTVMAVITSPPMWTSRAPWRIAYLRLVLVLGAMVDVLWLIYSEVYTIKAICLWCAGVHVITFFLFVLVVSTFPRLMRTQYSE
jgi:uncharacterized membrane protein